ASDCCLNVQEFRAKGDDATDDTKAIQATLDALVPKGGCICFPPGTYRVSESLVVRAPTHVQGTGSSSTVKAASANFHVFTLRQRSSGSRFTSLQIQGAAKSEATSQYAIYTSETQGVPTGVEVDHMLISGPDQQTGCNNGILLDRGAHEWTITNN